jgi:hypothetical protein
VFLIDRDAAAAAQLVVAEAGVVAQAAALHSFHASNPSSGPDQSSSGCPSLSVNPIRRAVVEEDVEVAPCLARRFDGLLGQVDRPVSVREGPGLLAPGSAGEDDVGILRRFGEVDVLHHQEQAVLVQDVPDAFQLRHGHGRVGGGNPQQPDGALFDVPEDLQGVRGRGPVRDDPGVNVPQVGQLLHVLRVLPVAEARQVAVGPAFPVVLGGGLAVHLQDSAAWPAQHAAEQVQVVDLARGRRRVGGLVEALQDRGKHPVFEAENLRRAPHVGGLHAAGFGHGSPGSRAPPRSADGPRWQCARRCSPHRSSRWRRARGPGRSSAPGWCPDEPPGARRRAGPPRWSAGQRTRASAGWGPSSRSSTRAHSTVCVSAMLWP